jgi:hypothetical protein
MRLVLVTKQSTPDESILAEAASQAQRGHEVIVLAAMKKGQPRFERLGAVKVERIDPRFITAPKRLRQPVWLYLLLVLMRLIGRVSRKIVERIGAFIADCTRHMIYIVAILARRPRSNYSIANWEQAVAWRLEFYQPDVTLECGDLSPLSVRIREDKAD